MYGMLYYKRIYSILISILAAVVAFAVALELTAPQKVEEETTDYYLIEEASSDLVFLPDVEESTVEDLETTTVLKTEMTGLSINKYTEEESIEEIRYIESKDDLYYLAAAICNEAGGSSEEIKLLVANVIINRVNSSLYPNTIYEVLTQRMQYGMMWKYGISFPSWADQSTINVCYEIADRILKGERVCPNNVLFQAEFAQGSGTYKCIDGMYFCYY